MKGEIASNGRECYLYIEYRTKGVERSIQHKSSTAQISWFAPPRCPKRLLSRVGVPFARGCTNNSSNLQILRGQMTNMLYQVIKLYQAGSSQGVLPDWWTFIFDPFE